MSDIKAEVHQIRFPLQVPLGELTAIDIPVSLTVFKWAYF